MDINENAIYTVIAILLGFTYGVLAQLKQFCFSGGIKDIILFKHTRRTSSLIVAITTAILSTQLISYIYEIDLTQTRYYININYIFIILGGAMFGYGMMISDGCSSRHLVKVAQGDKHSFYILLSLGIFSYITYSIFLNYSDVIFSYNIIQLTTVVNSFKIPLLLIVVVLFYLLYLSLEKCTNFFQILDGFAIGLLVAIVWFVTAIISDDLFIETTNQSLSFVYPLGKLIEYLHSGFNNSYLIFSVLTVIGVLLGAFTSSLFNKQYSKKYMCDISQQNPPSLFKKIIGGAFMGVGGILAIGCTVGQGLSGVSTLSFASFLAISSIYISGFITAKYMHKNNALVACFVFDFKPL
ncbi:Lipocalin-related protein and Bos/Can/Equ allergen [hydrothermal vent metagenome]|uniref:Lipocalin-related protein and Bos/Can/Equ allergen n=1 Tax=hydrothermal vent metagenome TaxID=652676 RepID=A0A3B1EAC6_9ZZZZ